MKDQMSRSLSLAAWSLNLAAWGLKLAACISPRLVLEACCLKLAALTPTPGNFCLEIFLPVDVF